MAMRKIQRMLCDECMNGTVKGKFKYINRPQVYGTAEQNIKNQLFLRPHHEK
jgi:hypothetical protein